MATVAELFDPNVKLQPLPKQMKDFLSVVDKLIAGHMSETIQQAGLALLGFFEDKTREWFKRDYSYIDSQIAEQLFTTQELIKDWPNQVRFQILALRKSLSRIIATTDSHLSQNAALPLGSLQLLREIVYASVALIESGEMAIFGRSIKYAAGLPNIRGSFEIWRASQDIFYGLMQDQSIGSSAYRPTTIFLIRQALELRLKNIFGVLAVEDNEGRPIRLKSDFFIRMSTSISDGIKLPVAVSIVRKIIKWSNLYIHSGIEPTPWEVEWALYILQPLFVGGSCEGTFSVHGSVRLLKEVYEDIPRRIQEAVHQDMNSTKSKSGRKLYLWVAGLFNKKRQKRITVIRLASPEAILVEHRYLL